MIDAFKAHLQNRLLNKVNNKGCVKCHLLVMGFKKSERWGSETGRAELWAKKIRAVGV
jgi:hypothetical protein